MKKEKRNKEEEGVETIEGPISEGVRYMRYELDRVLDEVSETRMELRRLLRSVMPKPLALQRLEYLRPLKLLKKRLIGGE